MGGGQLIEEVPLFAQLVEDELLVDDGAVKRYADIDGVEALYRVSVSTSFRISPRS